MELNIKIAKMEENLKNIAEKIDDHCVNQKIVDAKVERRFEETQTQMNVHFDNLETKIDKFGEKAEFKFAAKWIEKPVFAIIGMLALAALYFIFEKTGLK